MEREKHSIYGPSSADRWFECPGYIRLAKQSPPSPQSKAAAEGQQAHEVVQLLIESTARSQGTAEEVVEILSKKRPDVPADMWKYALSFVNITGVMFKAYDWVNSERFIIWVEAPVSYEHVVPGGFGTADLIIYDTETENAYVIDYKYGKGVRVEAQDNKQLALYAIGSQGLFPSFNLPAPKRFTVGIYQPRMEPDHLPVQHYTPEQLAEVASKFTAAYNASVQPEAPVKMGPYCRWCRAKNICPMHTAPAVPDDGITPLSLFNVPDGTGSKEDKIFLMKHLRVIEEYLAEIKTEVREAIKDDPKSYPFELKPGRVNKRWKSLTEAIEFMKSIGLTDDQIFETKVKSVAAIQKIAGTKVFSKGAGGLSHVLLSYGEPSLLVKEEGDSVERGVDEMFSKQ